MSETTTIAPAVSVRALAETLRGRTAVVLAGAGCSTESGIPDYRGPGTIGKTRKPMTFQEFVRSPEGRVRYWARSTIGWRRIAGARPNAGHEALARLEASGAVAGLITQNVDGLHQAAGSRRVVELHGSLGWVGCLECGDRIPRGEFQQSLVELNPTWAEEVTDHGDHAIAPDGDAELPPEALGDFRVPACAKCGGVMKPDVVFFGENVPAPRVAEAWELFDRGDLLLVVGSSLTVYSGRRFVYRAQERGVPIAVVNLGPTRADEMAALRVEGRLGEVLPQLAEALAR